MSAQLARIKEICLYVALTEDAQAIYEAKKCLIDNGVPFTLLAYMDDKQIPEVLPPLNTWTWGPASEKRTFTRFPVITWRCHLDDFSSYLESATSAAELSSKLLPHKALISS